MILTPAGGTGRKGALHRVPPAIKLLGLAVFAVAVMVTPGPVATVVSIGVGLVLVSLAGLGARALGRLLRGFALVALALLAFHVWQSGWERGFEVVGDLLALVLAASAVTGSTGAEEMIDTIRAFLGFLRPLRVNPERVAFAFSLVITSIGALMRIAEETRSAARARGLGRNPRAVLVPFVLRTVAHAQATGEALHARGIGDE